jgi:SAM-dependent methyltransferase
LVVDVGGGKSCPFAANRDPSRGTRIVAVYISLEELEQNLDVDEKRIADIMRELPFKDGEVDLLVSRSVLEHLEDIERFLENSSRVLKQGGHIIHMFPSKYAPFALINQLLPNSIARRLLFSIYPDAKGIAGFPASYDRCYYSAIVSLLAKHGFELVDVDLSYYQSHYFAFFLPLFLLSAFYETAVHALGAKNLCAYILLVARKA